MLITLLFHVLQRGNLMTSVWIDLAPPFRIHSGIAMIHRIMISPIPHTYTYCFIQSITHHTVERRSIIKRLHNGHTCIGSTHIPISPLSSLSSHHHHCIVFQPHPTL